MPQQRLPYQLLANKTIIATFVRPSVQDHIVEHFEEEYAKGRHEQEAWVVHPTRSFGQKTIDELMNLAIKEFSDDKNRYYPYFIILIDERTAQDGSVLLVQRDPQWPPQWEMRITPTSLSTFLSICNIGHTTIEDAILNDKPPDDDSWVYDVPFDHSVEHAHKTQREPVRMSRLTIGGVETDWFGAPPHHVLVLSGVYDSVRTDCA